MSECAQFESRMLDAASGGLSFEEKAALDLHVSYCVACRVRLAEEEALLARVDAGLLAMVAGEPSAAFAQRVMEEVTGVAEQKLLAAVDAGLTQSVAGEPSPQFAAAVRARIASEPAPRVSWFSFGWQMPLAGALAAGVALFVFWPSNPTAPEQIPNIAPPVEQVARVAPRESAPAVTSAPQTGTLRTSHPRVMRPANPAMLATVGSSAPELPEVLIPSEELQTVARFYRFVQEGRINSAQVLQANRIELAARLVELQTTLLVARSTELKTLDLVDGPRSTSDDK